ncbi:MAG: SpoIID/LytB domain-containing protein [Actinomycetota bacterium]|nr:SpoIID/LytB domain-containing protein [Actinomycetota bacterium]
MNLSRAVARGNIRWAAPLLACALAIPLLGSSAGAVATDQTFTVPANGSFTVVGHGFGHGHGMSQYGANGAARKGLKHEAILGFYYPGTKLIKTSGWLRVLITEHTSQELVILNTAGLVLRDRGTMKEYPLPANLGATQWRLGVEGTKTVVDYKTNAWHRYQPGGLARLVGDGVFRSSAEKLTLVMASGNRVYRDRLGALSPTPGRAGRAIVNVIQFDNYVKGVVPAEMPASWSPEAVQAQAVAARTYAWWSATAYANRYYQICDTTSCQVYRGYGGEYAASNAATDATSGQILTYQGRPAFTQFASSSGGWTSAGNVPYLPHKADPYDGYTGNPVHGWSVKVNKSTLEKRYPSIGHLQKIRVTRREGGGDWQGRVWDMTLVGSKGNAALSGETFRSIYGLRSSWFSFK